MDNPPPVPGAPQSRAEPQSFRARELNASLTVKDIHTSLAWYAGVLGFVVERNHERNGKLVAASLRAGAVQILINQDDGKKGFDRVKGEGFSLQFTTAQDIDALAKRVTSAGGTLATEPQDMPWGARIFRIVDPDGFKITISSVRA